MLKRDRYNHIFLSNKIKYYVVLEFAHEIRGEHLTLKIYMRTARSSIQRNLIYVIIVIIYGTIERFLHN